MVERWQTARHPAVAAIYVGLMTAALAASPPLLAQQRPPESDTPQARMRPIGEASAVDRYRNSGSATLGIGSLSDAAAARPRPPYRAAFPVQQAAMMQESNDASPLSAPSLPPAGGFGMPGVPPVGTPPATSRPPAFGEPSTASPLPGSSAGASQPAMVQPVPGNVVPSIQPLPSSRAIGGGLQPVPLTPRQGGSGDLSPLPRPELSGQFATVDNCACVSAPSSYTAGGIWGCDPAPMAVVYPAGPVAPPVYAPPPAVVVPPTVMPTTLAATTAAPCRPLITLGQGASNAQLGQGIIGQPTAYVPGQTVRNFIRYLSP